MLHADLSIPSRAVYAAAAGVPFDVADPFAKYAQPGIWIKDFDYSRAAASGLSRLYQTASGIAAVSATTQSIGLVFDESGGAAIESPLTSDDFSTYANSAAMVAAGWRGYRDSNTNDDNVIALSAARVVVTNPVGGDYSRATRSFPSVAGRVYRLRADAVGVSGSPTNAFLQLGANAGQGTGVNLVGVTNGQTVSTVCFLVATGTTSWVNLGVDSSSDAASIAFDNVIVDAITGNHLRQSTEGQRGTSQDVSGVKVWRPDAVDDNLLSALPPAAATTLFVRLKASSGAKYLAGTQGSASTRFYLTCNVSTGQLGAGVGSIGETTITGGGDIRSVEGIAVLRCTGSRVSLWWQPVGGSLSLLYDDVQTGAPTTTIPMRFGALNNNGALGTAPMEGDLYKIFAVQAAMNDADVAAMSAALAA